MRVLVASSRFWTDSRTLMTALALMWEPDAVLVAGAYPEGAEELAAPWRRHCGGQVEQWEFDSDQPQSTVVLTQHRRMLQAGADMCLAFRDVAGPHALGTMSRAAGVPTYAWAKAVASRWGDAPVRVRRAVLYPLSYGGRRAA